MHSPQLPHAFSLRSNLLILIYQYQISSLTQLTTNTFICTVCTLTVCTPCIHPCTHDPTLFLSLTHSLTYAPHHTYTHIHKQIHELRLSHSHTHTSASQNIAGLRHQTRCRKRLGQCVLVQVRLVLAHRRYWRVAQ